MNLPSNANRPPVLTSWKDIARYMGKGVRTVQRWEQDFGLPVRRPQGSSKKAILARPGDLDAWVALRCTSRPQVIPAACSPGAPHSPNSSPKPGVSLGALSALSAEIATSRLLCTSNRVLIDEMNSALNRLRHELRAFELTR